MLTVMKVCAACSLLGMFQIFCPRRLIRNLNAISTFARSQRSNFERDFFCVVKLDKKKEDSDCGALTIVDYRRNGIADI